MGQTLILSGLTEREVQSSSDGVPVLKDIPGIQYLFNNTSKLNYTSSVLILITPRPPPNDKQLMNQAVSHIGTLTDPGNQRLQAAIEKNLRDNNISIPSNIKNTYAHTLGNKLFLQFRAGDLTLQDWSTPTRLNSLIQDLKQLLHY
jgi:Flp pilus assembly secretin CpaC